MPMMSCMRSRNFRKKPELTKALAAPMMALGKSPNIPCSRRTPRVPPELPMDSNVGRCGSNRCRSTSYAVGCSTERRAGRRQGMTEIIPGAGDASFGEANMGAHLRGSRWRWGIAAMRHERRIAEAPAAVD